MMDKDIRSILKSDDRLNNEAIEKFISIQKEIGKYKKEKSATKVLQQFLR